MRTILYTVLLLVGLSAFAENHGCKSVDECARWTRRSLQSEGGCFGGFRRRNEGYHGCKPVEASLVIPNLTWAEKDTEYRSGYEISGSITDDLAFKVKP